MPVTLIGIVETAEGFTIPVDAPEVPLEPIIINFPEESQLPEPLCPQAVLAAAGCSCIFGPGPLPGFQNWAGIRCDVSAPAQFLEGFGTRDTAHSMSHDSTPVPTTFVP